MSRALDVDIFTGDLPAFLGFTRSVAALRPFQHGCSSRILGGWAQSLCQTTELLPIDVQAQLPKQTPGCLEEAGHVVEMLILLRIEDQPAD